MSIMGLIKRIRARIRAPISRRWGRLDPPPALEAWESFDISSFLHMLDELAAEAQDEAEALSRALRNPN